MHVGYLYFVKKYVKDTYLNITLTFLQDELMSLPYVKEENDDVPGYDLERDGPTPVYPCPVHCHVDALSVDLSVKKLVTSESKKSNLSGRKRKLILLQ